MKNYINLVTLACLGLFNDDVTASRIGNEISEVQQSMSDSYIAALSQSVIDIDEFLVKHHHHREEDSSGDDDEDNAEQQDVDLRHHHSSYEQIGRDSKGQFRNHHNYVLLRNKINEQESGHQEMFDSINAKLQDNEFLQQAIQSSVGSNGLPGMATPSATAQEKKLLSSESLGGMSDEDVTCYSGRYSDIGSMEPREHYLTIGQEEGRLNTCAKNLTSYEVQRYLESNPDLQRKFGRYGNAARILAREHWVDFGVTEKRSTAMPEWDEQWICGESDLSQCKCKGFVYMGYKKDPVTRSSLDTFEKMRQWKNVGKRITHDDWVQCNAREFNQSPNYIPENNKQCWCEPEPRETPALCSEENGECLCNGLVFWQQKVSTENKLANFYEGMNAGYTVNNANGTLGNQNFSIKCNSTNFELVRPVKELDHRCWCDENQKQLTADQVQQVKEYWRGVLREAAAKEEEIRAAAEAELERQKLAAAKAEEEEKSKALSKTETEMSTFVQTTVTSTTTLISSETESQITTITASTNTTIHDCEKKEADAKAKALKAEEDRKKAEEERIAAQKVELLAERQKLLDQAELDKEAAMKAAVEAALAEREAEHDKEEAERKLKEETAKLEAEKARKISEAEAKAQAEANEKIAKAATEKEAAEKELAHQNELIAAAENYEAQMQKEIADALETQRTAYEAKVKAEDEKRAKEKAEEERIEAEKLAQKEREQAAAKEARLAAKKEEEKLKAEAIAAEKLLKQQKEAEAAEKKRLEEEAYAKAKEEQKAKDDLLRAQKLEELAKTEDEVKEAQQKASAAQAELDKAKLEKQQLLDQKAGLDTQIADSQKALDNALLKEANAKQAALDAAESEAMWKQQAEDAKKKAADSLAKAEAEIAAHNKLVNDTKAANEAKFLAALKEQEAQYKKAQDAQKVAHDAAEAERKALEEAQLLSHQTQMVERQASFEKEFRHVWAAGPTGISLAHLNVDDGIRSDELLTSLFQYTLIADIDQIKHNIVRSFMKDGHEQIWNDYTKLVMVTSDDRVPELIEHVAQFGINHRQYPAFDLVVTPIATGSTEYIEWVKLQTMKKAGQAAFYNIKADPAMQASTTKVGEIAKVDTVTVSPTQLAAVQLNQQHPHDHTHLQHKAQEEESSDSDDSDDDEEIQEDKDDDDERDN